MFVTLQWTEGPCPFFTFNPAQSAVGNSTDWSSRSSTGAGGGPGMRWNNWRVICVDVTDNWLDCFDDIVVIVVDNQCNTIQQRTVNVVVWTLVVVCQWDAVDEPLLLMLCVPQPRAQYYNTLRVLTTGYLYWTVSVAFCERCVDGHTECEIWHLMKIEEHRIYKLSTFSYLVSIWGELATFIIFNACHLNLVFYEYCLLSWWLQWLFLYANQEF